LREDDELRERIDEVKEGVLVTEIRRGGPASKSDLKPGDIITTVDGRSVATATQLRNEVRTKKPGGAVTLEVMREGKPMKLKVYPELWPEPSGKSGE
jgi:S1-C subfamily serine protease